MSANNNAVGKPVYKLNENSSSIEVFPPEFDYVPDDLEYLGGEDEGGVLGELDDCIRPVVLYSGEGQV